MSLPLGGWDVLKGISGHSHTIGPRGELTCGCQWPEHVLNVPGTIDEQAQIVTIAGEVFHLSPLTERDRAFLAAIGVKAE